MLIFLCKIMSLLRARIKTFPANKNAPHYIFHLSIFLHISLPLLLLSISKEEKSCKKWAAAVKKSHIETNFLFAEFIFHHQSFSIYVSNFPHFSSFPRGYFLSSLLALKFSTNELNTMFSSFTGDSFSHTYGYCVFKV